MTKTLKQLLDETIIMPALIPDIQEKVKEWLMQKRQDAVENAFDEQVFFCDKLLVELQV